MSSNIDFLTKSHKIIATKRKARREQIKEVVFDEDARRDFLTGFHKRKVAKKEEAKKKAQDREKQERLEARREKRKMLAEQAAQNAEQVEKAYRKAIAGEDSGDEETVFTGVQDGELIVADEEYEDEEQLATVTVIEDFDPDTLIHGPSKPQSNQFEGYEPPSEAVPQEKTPAKPKHNTGTKKVQAKTATRVKDIKYQTKAERKVERTKQHQRKKEKASLAGGKSSRRKVHGRGKR